MAAPDLVTLLDFEGQFEVAAQQVMTAAGVNAFISQHNAELPVTYTGIGVDIGPALDVKEEILAPANWPVGQPPPQEYTAFTANLEFRVEVPRDDNGATNPNVLNLLAQIRATIRAYMLRVVMPFSDSNLPYYRVSDIMPQGAMIGTEQPRNIDFCTVRYLLTFRIQPDAWPAWPTP